MSWDPEGAAFFVKDVWGIGAWGVSIFGFWGAVWKWGWPRFWPFCRCNRRKE